MLKAIPMTSDSRVRSFSKSITWRVLATLTTVVIAYVVTQDTALALQIGGIEFLAKIAVYYLHERAWLRLPQSQ